MADRPKSKHRVHPRSELAIRGANLQHLTAIVEPQPRGLMKPDFRVEPFL